MPYSLKSAPLPGATPSNTELLKNSQPALKVEDLWRIFVQQRDPGLRERLAMHYLPLVKVVAGRLKAGLPGSVEYRDLVGAGLMGLVNCIDNFSPELGFKFETYAAPRIRGAILDGLRESDWLPRSYRRKSRQLDQAVEKLTSLLNRTPSDEEIAAELGLDLDEYLEFLENAGATRQMSLDARWSVGEEGDTASLHDIIPDAAHPDPSLQAVELEEKQIALKMVHELPDQERAVISLYYYEELTFREIGEVLGLTESRICQIHTRVLATLRARLKRLRE